MYASKSYSFSVARHHMIAKIDIGTCTLNLQAVAIKAIAGKIRDKYFVAPHAEAEAWERRTAENHHKDVEARGLSKQKLPSSMPSMEFKRIWSAKKDDAGATISIWHPIGPPGYKPLGDVISFGMDAPSNPVQVFSISNMIQLYKSQNFLLIKSLAMETQ